MSSIKNFFMIRKLWAIGIVFSTMATFAQDHGHLHIGAESQTPGTKLIFSDRSIFATNSLYVKTLTNAVTGTCAGYYHGNITLTGLAATDLYQGPEAFAASLGTYIFAEISHVEGPAGGSFGFWEAGATAPTISIPSGGSSTQILRVTSTDGSEGADPYGHIHGRRFTATTPGVYAVTFRALDQSHTGPGGGPIHMPSDPITVYFQADVNVFEVKLESEGARVHFGAYAGRTWQVEATDSLSSPNWTVVGDPVVGNDVIQDVLDPRPRNDRRFYRVKQIAP
jgi:hypothetical protein